MVDYPIYITVISNISFSTNISGIGTSTLIFKDVKELLKVRGNLLLSSVLASSSCLITIVETHADDEVLDVIDMVNDFRADRKRLLILAPTFNETMFKNVTINYDVRIKHSYGGDISILIHYGYSSLCIKTLFTPQILVLYTLYARHWARDMRWYSKVSVHSIYKTLWERR